MPRDGRTGPEIFKGSITREATNVAATVCYRYVVFTETLSSDDTSDNFTQVLACRFSLAILTLVDATSNKFTGYIDVRN